MSIKKNNSKKLGLIASTIIHLIVFILLTLPFMSLTYLDPPKQRTGGISINFGESEDLLPSNIEEVKDQNQSNNTNQKKSNSSKNKINSENNKNSQQNTNRAKDYLADVNSSNPSVDKNIYDDLYAKAKDKKTAEEEKNSELKEEDDEEDEEEKGFRVNGESSIGEIRFNNGQIRSVIKPVSPSAGTKDGKIHVTIYVDSNGKVIAAEINLEEENITDPIMQDECIKAALKTKFEPSNETEDPQSAEIEYNFDFKKE